MDDFERYGKYCKRAETHFLIELFIYVAIAIAIYYFTNNLFYVFLFVGYCFIGIRQISFRIKIFINQKKYGN